ncbi:hypothetical protein EON80_12480 [bacterium]|nr:MAG: hypothetical protein EON80_12480 [bacterium]
MNISRFPKLFVASVVLGALSLASCTPREETPTATAPPPKVLDTIYVPGADDKLHAKKVSANALDTQFKSGGVATPALEEIIKTAPKWFPKGARVEDVKETGDVVTLVLSPEFADQKHWQQGEKITELAVYSLVNSVAKDGKKVALTIDGKPASTFGEFDASGNIEANPALNAK